MWRNEQDLIGTKAIPKDAYYGIDSLRGMENFPISGRQWPSIMIESLALVKRACALTNYRSGRLDKDLFKAIDRACGEIIDGKYHDAFIPDAIQGGAGTTSNMNANEVIANLANEYLGKPLGSYDPVHPADHVNMSQSTNDVFPTAGKISCLRLAQALIKALDDLIQSLENKEREFAHIIKMGRTQLQDAVPISLGQEFGAYRRVLKRDFHRIQKSMKGLHYVNLGGTAIGTSVNVDPYYFEHIVPNLSQLVDLDLIQGENLVDETSNLDGFMNFSSALKSLAINLSKIASDLRLMSSGPRTMVGDIQLPKRQSGSSIMPGKVNPVIPEVVNQVSYRVNGNDLTVSLCVEGGQLELNAFEPTIFYTLFESLTILKGAVYTFDHHCIRGIEPNVEKMQQDVDSSVGMITALVPYLGYQVSTNLAKTALEENCNIQDLIIERKLLSEEKLREILNPLHMTNVNDTIESII